MMYPSEEGGRIEFRMSLGIQSMVILTGSGFRSARLAVRTIVNHFALSEERKRKLRLFKAAVLSMIQTEPEGEKGSLSGPDHRGYGVSSPPICLMASEKNAHVLVGVTGSVAALKLPLLVAELLKIPGLEVQVVTTENAKHFYKPEEIPVRIYSDSDEWQLWKKRTDPVLHIDLRRWADLMLVAPLDANTLAKIANGICDNLLTCVIRAWDVSKPLLFCPAMNTLMWEHPITARQVGQLKEFGYVEIPCIVKKLVCGDEGRGAMADISTIVGKTEAVLLERGLLKPR